METENEMETEWGGDRVSWRQRMRWRQSEMEIE